MPSMEDILKKITANDTSIIREGTNELQEALKNAEALPALCSIMQTNSDPQLRQAAAVFLKKRFTKAKHWIGIDESVKLGIKDALLKSLIAEPEKFVKNAIAGAIGVIVVVEDSRKQGWPELTLFLQKSTTSENQNDKELGFYTLNILTSMAPEYFMQHAGSFAILFNQALSNDKDQGSAVAYYAILCLTNFVPVANENPQLNQLYKEILPKVIVAIGHLVKKRPDRAHETMDLLFDMAERKTIDLMVQRLKQIICMCVGFVKDPTVKMDVQIKALSLISVLVQTNMSDLIKMELMVPVLECILKVLCEKPDDDEEETYFSSDLDDDTLVTCASATLDEIALNTDADILLPHILDFVERGMKGDDPYIQKACYLSIGIVSQGADEYIKSNCIGQFMKLVTRGIVAEKAVVRNAALFALGQFVDYLQPDANRFASEVMPILMLLVDELEKRSKGSESSKLRNAAERIMFCLQKLIENMEDAVVPMLPELLPRMLRLSCPPYETFLREHALITVEVIVASVKEEITPYFQSIMSVLDLYLLQPQSVALASLQVESVDTLGCILRHVGKDTFQSVADNVITMGLKLLQETDDPDMRKSCYGLFAAMSTVLKERIAPILPVLMGAIIVSLQSEEGFTSPDKDDDENNSSYALYGSDDEDDDDDDDGFPVENDFIEEKEESCFAIKELAEHAGESFIPYLETTFVEVMKLLNFPSEDLKRAAVDAATQLVISFANINTPEGINAANQVIPNFIGMTTLMVRTEEEKEVVTGVLEAFQHLLSQIGVKLDVVCKENILLCVKDVAELKTACQQNEDSEVVDEDEEDEELMEAAYDVLPVLGKCFAPNEFQQYFKHFSPLIKSRFDINNATTRANLLGTLSECISPLGTHMVEEISTFLTFVLCMTKQTDRRLRNNACYFLGEFLFHGKEQTLEHYSVILNALFSLLPTEKDSQVLDNICGAFARMLLVNPSNVPIEKIVSVLMENLPLKEDFAEDKWVFKSLSLMYQRGEDIILKCIGHIIKCAAVTLHSHSPDDETKEILVGIIQMTAQDFPNEFSEAVRQVPPEIVIMLQQICSPS